MVLIAAVIIILSLLVAGGCVTQHPCPIAVLSVTTVILSFGALLSVRVTLGKGVS